MTRNEIKMKTIIIAAAIIVVLYINIMSTTNECKEVFGQFDCLCTPNKLARMIIGCDNLYDFVNLQSYYIVPGNSSVILPVRIVKSSHKIIEYNYGARTAVINPINKPILIYASNDEYSSHDIILLSRYSR